MTGRGHWICWGTAGVLSVGLKLFQRITTQRYWHLLDIQSITQSSQHHKANLKLYFERTVCIFSVIYVSSLLFPFHLTLLFFSVFLHFFPASSFWYFVFPFSFLSPLGKILFRRSHVRDVAMKRLRFIDDYCRVKKLYCQLPSVPSWLCFFSDFSWLWGVSNSLWGSKVTPYAALSHAIYMGHETWFYRKSLKWRAVCLSYSETSEKSVMCSDAWVSETKKDSACWGNVMIFCCYSWRVVYFHVCHSLRSEAT